MNRPPCRWSTFISIGAFINTESRTVSRLAYCIWFNSHGSWTVRINDMVVSMEHIHRNRYCWCQTYPTFLFHAFLTIKYRRYAFFFLPNWRANISFPTPTDISFMPAANVRRYNYLWKPQRKLIFPRLELSTDGNVFFSLFLWVLVLFLLMNLVSAYLLSRLVHTCIWVWYGCFDS